MFSDRSECVKDRGLQRACRCRRPGVLSVVPETPLESVAMNVRVLLLSASIAWVASSLAGCGGAASPAERLSAADAARQAGDHAEALAGYEAVLQWSGDGTPTDDQRFKASIEAVKCLIQLGRAGEAVERYAKVATASGARVTYKETLAVMDTLSQENQLGEPLVALLEIAKERHPDHRDQFAARVEQLKQRMTDETLSQLASLGYL
jgi:hypothetical protein